MSYITGEDRDQITLFPQSIDEYISEDNPVRVIEAFVNNIDLIELGFQRAQPSLQGRPPYNPRDLLKLYIYGYLNRIRSSRKLETEASRNLEIIWLLSTLKPDFKTIADFRKDNHKPLKEVFKQFSLLCKEWDLFSENIVAIDGSKFRASNSKKKNYNSKKLQRHLKYLEEKIEQYINELEASDKHEEHLEKPTLAEIEKRIKELETRKQDYEEKLRTIEQGETTEISTVDPDARLMSVNNNGIDVAYNVQTVVDGKNHLIVDFEIINNPTDHGQLSKMANRAQAVLQAQELHVLADKGYYSTKELKECKKAGYKTYVPKQKQANATKDEGFYADKFIYNYEQDHYTCPGGAILVPGRYRKTKEKEIIGQDYYNYKACKTCSLKEKCTKSERGRSIYRNIEQKILDEVDERTRGNKELYSKRQMIVEHPFGTIKRSWGYTYFLTRGLKSVAAEKALTFLAYNLTRAINILGVKEIIKKLQVAL